MLQIYFYKYTLATINTMVAHPSEVYVWETLSVLYYFVENLLCVATTNQPASFPHLMAVFLSSSHVENKDSVEWSAGKQVQVADVIKKPWQGWLQANQMRR